MQQSTASGKERLLNLNEFPALVEAANAANSKFINSAASSSMQPTLPPGSAFHSVGSNGPSSVLGMSGDGNILGRSDFHLQHEDFPALGAVGGRSASSAIGSKSIFRSS